MSMPVGPGRGRNGRDSSSRFRSSLVARVRVAAVLAVIAVVTAAATLLPRDVLPVLIISPIAFVVATYGGLISAMSVGSLLVSPAIYGLGMAAVLGAASGAIGSLVGRVISLVRQKRLSKSAVSTALSPETWATGASGFAFAAIGGLIGGYYAASVMDALAAVTPLADHTALVLIISGPGGSGGPPGSDWLVSLITFLGAALGFGLMIGFLAGLPAGLLAQAVAEAFGLHGLVYGASEALSEAAMGSTKPRAGRLGRLIGAAFKGGTASAIGGAIATVVGGMLRAVGIS
ncbi:MAG: hypothetical protein EKK41_24035 [Hyphomicrobiales bacterium]|nr:MAG: hypothetical protein EKK41_24035 [Hyphomicrobiales bacterium]